MKYILGIFIGIVLLVVGSIIYIGESNSYKYEPRYFLGYSKGENYILDTQTGVTLEHNGYSYEAQSDYLYSYGKTGFLKLDLNSGQTHYLFDDQTDEIYKNAQKLFAESWKGEPLRLIGVALTNLTDESFEQLSLFEDNEKKERRRKLDATMDEIRKKFGNDKITRASIMNSSTGIAKKARAQMKNEDDKESRTVE